ncbi:Group II intron, maturase-specific domain family [Synechococcus sp. PCC 7335]|uniref:group II intron reverse transcriptase/maturase n=1 Tax=Synechococcus sp. (strain ATCC 29403 / PCC 7335) TaxID=91464 RepID=UPI00017EC489|nr:reverse transcriptase domain-containing protein [Synechococcus sp. PCC 7335]EDX82627.1 Group II intron, maturase-specific domain family [Synechococcus sp. PCC 7335]
MTHSAMGSDEWAAIDWKAVEKMVYRLQTRIFKAKRRGDTKQVHRLQKLLMKSRSAKLLAVRRVTQDNAGKKTAGVDGVKSLRPPQRFDLANNLYLTDKSKPTRRVMIPKPGTTETRPLGIPCMTERARQMLVKLALEPEWEAVFETNTYGFRAGRGSHDAIEAIFAGIRYKGKYVLDADISKCFDKINQKKLLAKLNTFPTLTRQIKAWLKSGVVMNGQLFPTEEGTPQGGVCSPLLALIALYGLETAIRSCLRQGRPQRALTVAVYADDFVVLHPSLEVILQCKQAAENWLNEMSLELKPSKTRISHTLTPHEGNVGFDFLGFNIRQHAVGKHQSGCNGVGQKLGFKTIIKPSKKKIALHVERVGNIIKSYKGGPQEGLIRKLNSVIRGWCNYYSTVSSKKTFSYCKNIVWSQLRAWARYKTGNFGAKTLYKYWHRIGYRLTFSTKDGVRLIAHSDIPIRRHVKVRGTKSYFDGDVLYWGKRRGRHPELPNRVALLLKKYKGKCSECGLMFVANDLIEVDHKVPKQDGGTDTFDNLQPLHRHCHDVKTARDNARIKELEQDTELASIKGLK